MVILLCAGVAVVNAQAQKTKQQLKQERRDRINKQLKEEEEGALVYSKQNAYGVKLNTDGWGVFYEHGKYKTILKTNLWWIDAGEHKNHKEEKEALIDPSGLYQLGNPVIYGKINNFYNLKIGFGQQLLIGGKGNKNGVAVTAIYGGGIAIGYLKPYYIAVQDANGNITNIRYSASTDSLYKDPSVIIGSGGFTRGWGQGTVAPGLHARVALRFDYGKYNQTLSALETGINAEYYTKDMRIMLDIPAQHFFFNAYIAIAFGNRK